MGCSNGSRLSVLAPGDLRALGEWCEALYRKWNIEHQGLIAPDVPIAADILDDFNDPDIYGDDYALLAAVYEFADWAEDEALLLPAEYSLVALVSQSVESYLAKVHNGGHPKYLTYDWNTLSAKACEVGLAAMGCVEHAAIFSDFKAFIEEDRARAIQIVRWYNAPGSFSRPEGVKAFDRAVFDLSLDRQVQQQAKWLQSSGVLTPMRREKVTKKAVIEKNALRRERSRSIAAPEKQMSRAIRPIAKALEEVVGHELGEIYQCGDNSLLQYFFGSDPVSVPFCRFFTTLADGALRMQDVVLMRPPATASYQAFLFGRPDFEVLARVDITEDQYMACTNER